MAKNCNLVNLIENESINQAFIGFLQKLELLINQKIKIIDWADNGTCILIDIHELSKHLSSEYSLFDVPSVFDFIKILNVLGFERSCDHKPGYEKFYHSNFQKNKISALMSDLQLPDWIVRSNTISKNYKSMENCMSFLKDQILQNEKIPITKEEFFKLQIFTILHYEKKIMEMKSGFYDTCNEDNYYNKYILEPNYIHSKEIAGYYGNVTLDQLQTAFPQYYPSYKDEEQTFQLSEIPVINDNTIADQTIEVNEIVLPEENVKPPKAKKQRVSELDEAILNIPGMDSFSDLRVMHGDDDNDFKLTQVEQDILNLAESVTNSKD